MRRRLFISIMLTMLFCAGSFPQQIMNVKFTQSGNQVIITYDITGSQPGQTFDNVQVYSNLDNYASPLRSVRGDIGTVTAGVGKRITWDVLSDRERLNASISFEVRAPPRASKATAPAPSSKAAPSSDDYWVYIPGGTFMMGSPESEAQRNANETQHQVTVSSFRLAKY